MAEEWGFSNASFDYRKIAPHQGVKDGGLQVLSSNMQGQELVSARFRMLDLQDHDRPLPERFTVVVLGKDRRSSLAARAESLRVDFGVVEDARTKIQAQIANAKKQPSTKKHPSAKARRSMARKQRPSSVGEQALEKLEERLAASKTGMKVGDKLARRALLEAGRLARDTGGVIFSDSVESLLEGSHAELYQAAHECGRDKLLESCEGEERWLTLHAYVYDP
ncbi:hypothetical protein SELMODRAFT_408164 [Selaginella moellendorffii]|uniref:Uncharacterized protein n=1 Tax=Selaginella moellendorffii TaxID=88036 RepID=D8R7E5_SELML|nr:hypothetical protein SELMODRAFT_408164 [Selaginella moellendorffii]